MKNIYKEFTDSVDECRQRAFAIRKALGRNALKPFIAFDALLTKACEEFTSSVREVEK